jgi:membrane protein YdbS with pleckstrin-like domain
MLKEPTILEVYGYRPLLKPYKKNYAPFASLLGLIIVCYLLLASFCFPCTLYTDSTAPVYLYSFSSFAIVILVIILVNINPGYIEAEKHHSLSVPST